MLNPKSPLPQHQAHPSTSTLEPSRPIQLIRNNDHLIGHEFILRSQTRHDLIFPKATCDEKTGERAVLLIRTADPLATCD
jgi:hypothetical protein